MAMLIFARLIVGVYCLGFLAINAAIVSDLIANRRIGRNHETRVGWRIASSLLWPILILSRAGRALLLKNWKGVL